MFVLEFCFHFGYYKSISFKNAVMLQEEDTSRVNLTY